MRDKALQLLKELTESHSVSGFEDEVRAIFARELGDVGSLSCDRNGSVICDTGGQGAKIMVAGHMDEVGFMVQHITPEGFLQFLPLGGWWPHNLLSQRVEVKTADGRKLLGVVASKPPHFLSESQRQKVMSIDQMFVDIGAASRAQATEEFGVALGDPIAPVSTFSAMEAADHYMAKAFDNRVGIAGAIQAGLALAGRDDRRLLLAGTVQEEMGLRGARTAAAHARPDAAIVLEGPPADDTPGFPRSACQGRLGGGVQIRLFDTSAIGNPRFARMASEVARAEHIPHQITVRRSGGTDAGSFHLAETGIPCVVLGVPARYIHSHNAIIDLNDYLHMVSLTQALIRHLDESAVTSLTDYLPD